MLPFALLYLDKHLLLLRNERVATGCSSKKGWCKITRLALILAVALVPLVVYRVVDVEGGFTSDLYATAKATVVIFAALLAAVSMVWARRRPNALVLCLVCPLAILLMLSSAFSSHPQVVLWGAPYLAEGLIVLISYLVLMIAASDRRYWDTIMRATSVGVLIMTMAGIAEHWGYSYITNAPYWAIGMDAGEKIRISAEHSVSALLGNGNHLGSYVALTLPLMTMLSLDTKGRWAVAYAASALGGAFLLMTSYSRCGTVGAFAGVIVGLTARGRGGRSA